MSGKRKRLELKAESFAVHALPQPDPVQVATAPAQPPATPPTVSKAKGSGQPSRAGKVQVVAWVTPERRSALKIKATKLGRTVDDLLSSMIDDLVTS
jgi:hypothetical protein